MKLVLSLCLLALSGVLAVDHCLQDVSQQCAQNSVSLTMASCNSVYGSFKQHVVAAEMQAFANLHLERSFEYLLSAAYYNNYKTNRDGFSKLFRKLSDNAWEKTFDIIKHITMRGGHMDFTRRSSEEKQGDRKNYTAEVYELQALAKALDTEKELAERAFFIHREATKNSKELHDPEIVQYLEEEFIEDQAKRIRELAGYTSDIKRFIDDKNGQDLSIGLYLFDEYLQKTA